MTKPFRQGQITRLIERKSIHTQDELARELAALNIAATQATLSRDIQELGLVKTPGGYRQVQAPQTGPGLETVVAEFLLDARTAQNLVVLRTSPGNANALAVAIDRASPPEAVGTLAGDDTIFLATPDAATAGKLRDRLLRMLR